MNIVYKRMTLQKGGICFTKYSPENFLNEEDDLVNLLRSFTKSLERACQPLVACLLGWNHKW